MVARVDFVVKTREVEVVSRVVTLSDSFFI